MNTCSIEDCEKPRRAREWCVNHYKRWQRHGDPRAGGIRAPAGATVAERFWSKVDKDGPVSTHRPDLGQCWVWTAGLRDGYGNFGLNGKMVGAHRMAWRLSGFPEPPPQWTLDHLCRVRRCARPSHLEPVDNRTNVLRGEGPTAVNAVKTHCKHGHEFTPANTRIDRRGYRFCRACAVRFTREYLARKRAAV